MIFCLRASMSRIHASALSGEPTCLQFVQHALVGAAVQRAFERADGGRDGRMQIGKRRSHHAGRERRGVEFVLGVHDHRKIERLAPPPASASSRAASARSFRRASLRASGGTGSLPCKMRYRAAITTGNCAIRRSAFRKLASRLLLAASGSQAASRLQPLRMMSIIEAASGMRRRISISSAGIGALARNRCGKLRQLVALRQFAVQNQVRHFLVRGALRQFFGRIPAIQQPAGQRANRRVAGDNVIQARTVDCFCHSVAA